MGENYPPAVLVVGGTDGSGTRRVVQTLTELGVLMVSEDQETYDIHGDLMGGWPPIVTPVIQTARNLNYDPKSLPSSLQSTVRGNLNRLVENARRNSHLPQSFRLGVGGALPIPSTAKAKNVEFGFKAPVAMTLAPWWANIMPNFMFLHVLRDGRDIGFSANQGPVDKFYRFMYGVDQLDKPVKGVRLWSDWNTQLLKWAREKVNDAELDKSNERSFSYMMLHSEDLVSPSVPIRFAAILHLAQWVGSNLTEHDLCCLAVRDSTFMGSHDRTDRNAVKSPNQVSSRYGKWKSLVNGNPTLEAALHKHGGEGLQAFGYEPLRQQASDRQTSDTGYQCKLSPEMCGAPPKFSLDKLKKRSVFEGKCDVWDSVDFKGSDLSVAEINASEGGAVTEEAACCQKCSEIPVCKAFTFDRTGSICYLKTSKGDISESRNTLVSGAVKGKGHRRI